MIMTKNCSLMPRVIFFFAGAVMYVVLTFVPMISRTDDWMSGSVILFMWPFLTVRVSQVFDIVVTVGVEELQWLASIKV